MQDGSKQSKDFYIAFEKVTLVPCNDSAREDGRLAAILPTMRSIRAEAVIEIRMIQFNTDILAVLSAVLPRMSIRFHRTGPGLILPAR